MKQFVPFVFVLLFLSTPHIVYGQEEEFVPAVIDSLYREDQFYIAATYNLILNRPSGMQIQGLSGGIQFGYLRDMPINKRRNLAVAIGAGLSFDRYGQNLFIGETPENETIFTVLDGTTFDANRFVTATAEVPIEFRWRSSTTTNYRFWRVYAGMRIGYVYYHRARFKQVNNEVNQTDIPELERLRLGATLSFGHSTFNLHSYLGLNPFFKNATTTQGESVDLLTLKLGIIFYIL